MILGKYDFGEDVYVDGNHSDDRGATIVHEITHLVLTQGSVYGVIMGAFRALSDTCVPKLSGTLRELMNASITTQEMTALYSQCFTYKQKGEEALDAYLAQLKSWDYYRKYCISGFDALVKSPQYLMDGTFLLQSIAIAAMNISLAEFDGVNWLEPAQVRAQLMQYPKRCNPDSRYRALVRVLLDSLSPNREVSLQEVTRHADIDACEMSSTVVSTLLDHLAAQLEQSGIANAAGLIGGLNIKMQAAQDNLSIETIIQKIIPGNLNLGSPSDVRLHVLDCDYQSSTVTLMLNDGSPCTRALSQNGTASDLLILYQAATGKYSLLILSRENVQVFLQHYKGEIILFGEDYDNFHRFFPSLANRRVFFRFDGQYPHFIAQIRTDSSIPHVHFHQVTNDTYCIFIVNKRGEVFFTLQLNDILQYVLRDINNKKFIYTNVPDDSDNTDPYFYLSSTDWCRYEDVILSTIGKSMMDLTKGLPALGHRINLEGL